MPPPSRTPPRAAKRWAGCGRGGRPDRAATTEMRAAARAGHQAAATVVVKVRTMAAAIAHQGRAKGSTRCSAIDRSVGTNPNHPASPTRVPTIAISASAAQTPAVAGNLPTDQLVLHLAPGVDDFQGVPSLSAAQRQEVTTDVDRLSAAINASWVLPLDEAYDPQSGTFSPPPGSTGQQGVQPGATGGGGGHPTPALAKVTRMDQGENVSFVANLYAATPAVLDHYGIPAAEVNAASDVISSRRDLAGLQIFYPGELRNHSSGIADPRIQDINQLPVYTSDPGTLITPTAMQALGLQPTPAAWLIQTRGPLTTAQIQTAQNAAATAGLYVETRTVQTSLAPLRDWSTAAGILLALAVLGMTVGLIRSETANDLRTLAATGASSTTRRSLTGATAGALALLGALLGTSGAYAALLAWHRNDLSPLGRVPVVNLVVILAGLPLIATIAGWLLAGGEPPVIARRPIE